ncbi:MAG: GTA-gp10 family protein [Pseudomonadota bacterium]
MANPYRGEVALRTPHGCYTLRLTLGALASLENTFGAGSFTDLLERLLSRNACVSDMRQVLEVALVADDAGSNAAIIAQLEQQVVAQTYVALMRVSFSDHCA